MPRADAEGMYPNDLLMWETIKWAADNGYKKYEMTWANTRNICRFKSKFNPYLTPYFSCEKYSPAVSALHAIKDAASWRKQKGWPR